MASPRSVKPSGPVTIRCGRCALPVEGHEGAVAAEVERLVARGLLGYGEGGELWPKVDGRVVDPNPKGVSDG
jgi:hypothetical protein